MMNSWTICCRCGQPNESERMYCWVCFRDFANPATAEDYRKLLGVESGADPDHLRMAYRRLAIKYHPDKNPVKTAIAEAQFKMVNEAYQTLSGVKASELLVPAPSPSPTPTPESSGPSSEEFEAILGDFGFQPRPTFFQYLSLHRKPVLLLSAAALALTIYEVVTSHF